MFKRINFEISVPIEVKKRLEQAKGEKELSEIILEIFSNGQSQKGKKAF